MKIKLLKEEWYPVVSESPNHGKEVEVPAALLKKWRQIITEFNKLNQQMLDLLAEAYSKD